MDARALLLLSLTLDSMLVRGFSAEPAREVVQTVEGVEHVLLVERIGKSGMWLLPDTCFFSGTSDGLKLTGASQAPDPLQFNGGNTYATIDGLQNSLQVVVWPLQLRKQGVITGRILGKGSGRLSVTVGGQRVSVDMRSSQGTFTLQGGNLGQVELAVSPETFRGSLERVELEGPGLEDAALLRARWRPAAVHAGFTASTLGKEASRLWIMEVRPLPCEKDFYCPITTPFGYFGSTFNADGSSGGINFSMWSFSAGKQEPPIAQLSHLLAVGSAQATFGGFNHEGTGVKLRGWNPYANRRVTSAPIALRWEPGTPYDTYTGYFFDEASQSWRLYASGRKWSEKGSVQSLLPGCFVEVPGPPNVQRTGHIVRAADLRGWCRDTKGVWHTFDRMNGSKQDAAREQTNCLWSHSADNWFRMAIGGMTHFRYQASVSVEIPKFKELPAFLAPEKVRVLDQVPCTIRVLNAARQGAGLVFEVELSGSNNAPSRIKAFFGAVDALSFAERWEHTADLGSLKPGRSRLNIPQVPAAGFIRLQAVNGDGIFLSSDAGSWK